MPISTRHLGEGEEVLVDLHPHWAYLMGPSVLTVVALAVVGALTVEFPRAPVGLAWLLAAMVAVPALWLGVRCVRWYASSLVVTTSRLVLSRGVFRRDVVQLRLQRVTEVHCTRSVLQQIIGAGRLVVEVQGEEGAVVVDDVRRPRALQRVINARLEALHTEAAGGVGASGFGGGSAPTPPYPVEAHRVALDHPDDTPPQGVVVGRSPATDTAAVTAPGAPVPAYPGLPPAPGGSVHQQLIQLDDLLQRGIVTPTEFAMKKAELLRRM